MNSLTFRTGFVALISLAIILGAYGFQYIGGLPPCELCYWQRYPYFVIVPLALMALALSHIMPGAARGLMVLCTLAYLVGAGIAGYHSGVEYGWWPGPETCSPMGLSIEEMLSRPVVVRCDEVPWSLFGISMAGYNFILSVLMAGFCLLSIRKRSV